MYRHIETYRGFVQLGSGDHKGRVNASFYLARFDEASRQFLAHLGLSPSVLKPHDRAAMAVEQRTRRQRDVCAGGLLHITTELLDIGEKSFRFVHRMYDSETMEEVAVAEFVGVCYDAVTSVSIIVPDNVREKAIELLGVRAPQVAQPRRPVAA